jgi:DNA-binding transcriptional LysR family regulator
LRKLEKELGASLIWRTTRRLQPTSAGMVFYKRLKEALADIESARREAAEEGAEITGSLRVGSSNLFGPTYVVSILAAFMDRHPGVTIDLVLADNIQDMIGAELDLAVRIGTLADSRLVARQVATFRRVTFAAPSYLAKRGRPAVPQDLKSHACVVRTMSRSPQRWEFSNAEGLEYIDVESGFRSNSASACNAAVAGGLGIGIAPLWQIADLVAAEKVELILTEFEPEPTPVHIVWPQASLMPARTRALVDFLGIRLKSSLNRL